jgi:hypothetical protein
MRIAAAFVALGSRRIIVRMRSVLVAIGVLRPVRVALRNSAVLVMPECHALPCYDGRHALGRNGQRQQENRKKTEDRSRHRQAL